MTAMDMPVSAGSYHKFIAVVLECLLADALELTALSVILHRSVLCLGQHQDAGQHGHPGRHPPWQSHAKLALAFLQLRLDSG